MKNKILLVSTLLLSSLTFSAYANDAGAGDAMMGTKGMSLEKRVEALEMSFAKLKAHVKKEHEDTMAVIKEMKEKFPTKQNNKK